VFVAHVAKPYSFKLGTAHKEAKKRPKVGDFFKKAK
jgi:hypothetical protein